ncbi:hypothetical protein ACN6MT_17125 [Neobacillus niacini]|uniref:hypothetical protein n=1 Tax=Neobacillus niacini TaxID=86668 RepID=UPI003B01E0FB
MNSKSGKSNKENNKPILTNESDTMETNKSIPAQEDGFRYDYNDSSDFSENKMS